jgi:beta-lactamase class A
MKSIFYKKIPLIYVIICIIVSCFCTYLIDKKTSNINANSELVAEHTHLVTDSTYASSCNYQLRRLVGYKYIKPLLGVENNCPSEKFTPLIQTVSNEIQTYKKNGVLNSASIYLKDFSSNEWIGINENEKYIPGSLLKIPILIAYLKMNEDHPGLLNKTFFYEKSFYTDKDPTFLSKSIEPGHKYTVKQLLTYMVAYSDNNATQLLNANINVNVFFNVFNDLGLSPPARDAVEYPISAKEYSLFMRALYNASYLTKDDSEFAAELLSECDFKQGIAKGLPPNVQLAHKFGESGNDVVQQLHESAIIYLNNKTYLVTIMTKGKDFNKLSDVISQISHLAKI